MTIWEDIAKAFGGNVEYSYPTGGNPMAERSLAYFMPRNASMTKAPIDAALPIDPNAPRIPEKAALASFLQQQYQQPQTSQPQSQIPEPYNMLERVFLGAGGQGAAVKADKERYQLAKLAESIPADSQDPVGSALRQYAMQSPDGAKSYLEYVFAKQKSNIADWEVKEVNGKLVKYNKNNPTQVESISGDAGSGVDVKGEGDLRTEFDGLQKEFKVVQRSYKNIEKVATKPNPSASDDMALVFSLMKLYDPSSSVKETEYANAENAQGVPEQLRARWNKVKDGTFLDPKTRSEFLATANDIYISQGSLFNESARKYRGLAKDYGYSPDRIVKEIVIEQPPKPDPLAQKKAEIRAKIDAIKKQRGLK